MSFGFQETSPDSDGVEDDPSNSLPDNNPDEEINISDMVTF